MTRTKRRVLYCLALALAAGAAGCVPMRSLFASPDDYAAYRATRVASTFDDRLAAADLYLKRFPHGNYAPEVRAYFDEAEPIFYAAKRASIPGLAAYLRALPAGPRSAEVLAELRALRTARADQDELIGVASMGARLTARSAQRARVRTELITWLQRFLDTEIWPRPMVEAPAELIIPWSLGLPAPICGRPKGAPSGHVRRCAKLVELPYTVTVGSQPEERQATVEIAVDEDAWGRPLEVTIGGPDLFLRLEETFSSRAIAHDDTAGRMSAAARAVELVRHQFEERLGTEPDCRRQPRAPSLLDLACKGFHLTVRGAAAGGEDDAIVISKLRPRGFGAR